MYTVAVNIIDLASLGPMAGLLLAGYATTASPTVIIDHDLLDTDVVVLDGPAAADEERVKALVELLQTSIGPRKLGRRVRCYERGPRGGWNEIRLTKKIHNKED